MLLADVIGSRRARGRRHGARLRQPPRDAGHAVLLRAGLHARRPRLRRRRDRARRGGARRAAAAGHRGVPEVLVDDVRAAMAPAAAALAGDPTARLTTVGITGHQRQDDDGLPRARAARGRRARDRPARHGDRRSSAASSTPSARTTPEAIDLQRTFADMLAAGDDAVVMEVSSHALALHRADAIHWSAAVFTNLTQDHLDFHADMEDYFLAKRRLFEAGPELAVVNVDDPYGARLAGELPERDPHRPRRPRRRRCARRPSRRRRERLALRGRRRWRCARRCRAASTSSTRWRAVVVARELGVDDAAIAARAAARRARARALRARRRGPALRGHRRLLAQARRAGERAARGPRAGRGPA